MEPKMYLDGAGGRLARDFARIARGLAAPAFVTLPLSCDLDRTLQTAGLAGILRTAGVAWRPAGHDTMVAGYGREMVVQGPRDSTLVDAASVLRGPLALDHIGESAGPTQPAFFGGARFGEGGAHDSAWDAFGGWRFVLPRVLFSITGDRVEGSVTLRLDPGTSEEAIACRLSAPLTSSARDGYTPRTSASTTSESTYRASVDAALEEIAADRYEKVVLARTVAACRPEGIDPGLVLSRLAERYTGCYIFKMSAGGSDWVGATPELLCQAKDRAFETMALAASAPRGSSPELDDEIATRLLGDAKERNEHALVVEMLMENLGPYCESLTAAGVPEILRTPTIQHLRTSIAGRLRTDASLLGVLAALHPSPAVGGAPRPEALDAITRLEGMDRGWYAGPIGRLGLDGDGEFAVGLRSGLLRGNVAQLYAGAGIVTGSDSGREYAETQTKLRPLLEAINGD